MLTPLDLSIISAYFIVVIFVGIFYGRREKGIGDFILGGKQVPWFAVLCSIVATEISAVTFLATPAVGFNENLNYLQFGFGSIVARVFVAYVFLTAFYAIRCYTIYQYLDFRFGPRTHYCATIIFFITRILGSSVRLLIASVAFSILLDVSFIFALILCTTTTVLYTSIGGIKAVIASDIVQVVVFLTAAMAVILFLHYSIGWREIMTVAGATGHLEIFRFFPSDQAREYFSITAWFSEPTLFYLAFLNGFFITAAAMGTDQDLTQRMLTCKHVKGAQRSLILSGFIGFPITILFLLIGVGLFVFYQVNTDPTIPMLSSGSLLVIDADKIFSHFISHELPSGIKGLLIIGIIAVAMSSLDSAINALGASAVIDLYQPLLRKPRSDKHYLMVSRIFVVIFSLILAGVAFLLRDAQGFLWLSFKLVSIGYGPLLGVFLVGTLTQRGHDQGNLFAMLFSLVFGLCLLVLIENHFIALAWPWVIVLSTGCSYCLAISNKGITVPISVR